VLAVLRSLDEDRVNAIRNWTASGGMEQTEAERRLYWCASTILRAWPSGRAYLESWIDG
jgi:hypothetical protein